ncbi:hypothetical protein KAJ41_02220 [Candidatus Parcubacteria bacterium]|nr:hypothetical protein [Candidatus Parcubacteria bacterium]
MYAMALLLVLTSTAAATVVVLGGVDRTEQHSFRLQKIDSSHVQLDIYNLCNETLFVSGRVQLKDNEEKIIDENSINFEIPKQGKSITIFDLEIGLESGSIDAILWFSTDYESQDISNFSPGKTQSLRLINSDVILKNLLVENKEYIISQISKAAFFLILIFIALILRKRERKK